MIEKSSQTGKTLPNSMNPIIEKINILKNQSIKRELLYIDCNLIFDSDNLLVVL
jgi:hypothetical protein